MQHNPKGWQRDSHASTCAYIEYIRAFGMAHTSAQPSSISERIWGEREGWGGSRFPQLITFNLPWDFESLTFWLWLCIVRIWMAERSRASLSGSNNERLATSLKQEESKFLLLIRHEIAENLISRGSQWDFVIWKQLTSTPGVDD